MALKYQLDTLEELNESLHEYYREEGGKYFLDVEGAKPVAEVEKVTTALTAERKVSKQYKDAVAAWETKFAGKKPDEIAAELERIPLLEAESQGKVDAKRHSEVVEQTVKSRVVPYELEITKLKQALSEHENVINEYKSADRRRTIHDAVRAIAAKEGFQESSYAGAEGALMLLAERHLTINSAGDVVVSDDSRSYTPGLGLREALGEIKNQHPYLLKQSVGGGAVGSSGGAGPSNNPFKEKNLGARAKFLEDNKGNPDKIKAAMKAAGITNPFEGLK